MKVSVQLHAMLRDLLPGGKAEVEVPEGSTLTQLLDRLGVPEDLRDLVTINSKQVHGYDGISLTDGDVVAVFPGVTGGARSPYIDVGLRLINEGQYFLAHETLEEHWAEAPQSDRDFLQGLIHVAVAMHHHTRGNLHGAKLQFGKASKRLADYPPSYLGVDVEAIRRFVVHAQDKEPGELPKL